MEDQSIRLANGQEISKKHLNKTKEEGDDERPYNVKNAPRVKLFTVCSLSQSTSHQTTTRTTIHCAHKGSEKKNKFMVSQTDFPPPVDQWHLAGTRAHPPPPPPPSPPQLL
ncbi:hypothetical protein EGR_10130 [Echinococcus granulosus]|uniref:Uncharacterized protein n=1 Tax=Echinococcus granulosus TaxID=6210 RepID=W6U954_ECHGR|nr:hypothetical protein EGR_10130 [Echinococcus granulosus]EUB55012.1 hypothetical protein EGR_10130 [Echinococcus granulosus]